MTPGPHPPARGNRSEVSEALAEKARAAAPREPDGAVTPAPPPAEGPWTVRSLLNWINGHLAARGVESPRLCAEILVCHVLGCERLRLYMDADRVPSEPERALLRSLVLRAGRHEPVQYLVGTWPFRGRDMELGRCTLIPRPATETIVEQAVTWYRQAMSGQPLRMADIGTGTGVIAISIIAELRSAMRLTGCRPLAGPAPSPTEAIPEIQVGEPSTASPSSPSQAPTLSLRCLATDVVPDAVELARRNAARHGLSSSIDVRLGSLFEPFRNSKPHSFDLICSNPPYISDAEWDKVAANVRDHEPESALRGGPDGLEIVRPLVEGAPRWLRSGGLLLVEIGFEQGPAALALAGDRSLWESAEIIRDFEELPRVLRAVRA